MVGLLAAVLVSGVAMAKVPAGLAWPESVVSEFKARMQNGACAAIDQDPISKEICSLYQVKGKGQGFRQALVSQPQENEIKIQFPSRVIRLQRDSTPYQYIINQHRIDYSGTRSEVQVKEDIVAALKVKRSYYSVWISTAEAATSDAESEIAAQLQILMQETSALNDCQLFTRMQKTCDELGRSVSKQKIEGHSLKAYQKDTRELQERLKMSDYILVKCAHMVSPNNPGNEMRENARKVSGCLRAIDGVNSANESPANLNPTQVPAASEAGGVN